MRRKKKQTDPFYTSGPWLRVRGLALDRDCGLCVWCRDVGRYARDKRGRRMPVLATLVHHIKPRKTHPELELVLDNLVSLCDRCHDEAHPEKHEAMGQKKKDDIPEIAKGICVVRL